MKLKSAFLCINCEEVYDIFNRHHSENSPNGCPVCGSSQVHSLARWLSKMSEDEEKFSEKGEGNDQKM